jgi:putative nucleotidyltransferase with HDIG domain
MSSHGFTQAASAFASRRRFAQSLRERQRELAVMVCERIAVPHRSLLPQVLLREIARAIESADPGPVIEWARMMRLSQPPQVLVQALAAACEVVANVRLADDGDHASLLVFLEILQSRVGDAVRIDAGEVSPPGDRDIIEGALVLLRARDEATCSHSLATGEWCRRLCAAMGLDPVRTEHVVRAGVLHDIGKIGTPDAILFKASPLSPDEWTVMKQHAMYGAELLLELPGLTRYAPTVRSHHERMDGRGYPDGLVGTDIPEDARIVAIADAFHAMVSDRPYRRALSYGAAIEELRAGAGTQWDENIVDIMIAIVAKERASSAHADSDIGGADLGDIFLSDMAKAIG